MVLVIDLFTILHYHNNTIQYEVIPISETNKRSCVVCAQEFTPTDDVVVCPVCGAPHHRECWQSEGHCHYEVAHGTDLEWHPKEQPESEEPKPREPQTVHSQQTVRFINGRPVMQCPSCGHYMRITGNDITCSKCGKEIHVEGEIPRVNPFGDAPVHFGEPIDGVQAEKVARIVLQRNEYYLPRFRALKKQGRSVCSWNWAACLLTPYWFAFRKCYLWAAFSLFINLLSTILYLPMVDKIIELLPDGAVTYSQIFTAASSIDPASSAMLWGAAGALVLVLRGIVFGLLGNYIYKKECLKRVAALDQMQPSDASAKVFKLSGISILAPLITMYAGSILEDIVMNLL